VPPHAWAGVAATGSANVYPALNASLAESSFSIPSDNRQCASGSASVMSQALAETRSSAPVRGRASPCVSSPAPGSRNCDSPDVSGAPPGRFAPQSWQPTLLLVRVDPLEGRAVGLPSQFSGKAEPPPDAPDASALRQSSAGPAPTAGYRRPRSRVNSAT
jgi:hypothetical protein